MNQKEIEETRNFLNDPEISIWIDKYDDVFCEFDSRPFANRALSDDFLREVHKMISEKTAEKVLLKFNVLNEERNEESEAIILNNINTHFKYIEMVLKSEQKQILHKGYMLLGLGFGLISCIFLLTIAATKSAYLNGVILMLEPVGWFVTWTGMDNVFQISRKNKSALDFNSKMVHAEITFSSVDAIIQEAASESPGSRQKTVIPIDNNNLRVA